MSIVYLLWLLLDSSYCPHYTSLSMHLFTLKSRSAKHHFHEFLIWHIACEVDDKLLVAKRILKQPSLNTCSWGPAQELWAYISQRMRCLAITSHQFTPVARVFQHIVIRWNLPCVHAHVATLQTAQVWQVHGQSCCLILTPSVQSATTEHQLPVAILLPRSWQISGAVCPIIVPWWNISITCNDWLFGCSCENLIVHLKDAWHLMQSHSYSITPGLTSWSHCVHLCSK